MHLRKNGHIMQNLHEKQHTYTYQNNIIHVPKNPISVLTLYFVFGK